MTLSTTTNRIQYSGNGATTGFSFPYYFLLDADLVVIVTSSAGVETVNTLTTDYTISGAGAQAGGTVTMLTAPASGETLTIYRDAAVTQDLDLVENDPLPAEEIEERLDKLTMLVQRTKDRLDRALILKESDSSAQLTIPLLAERASKFLAFDASGNAVASATVPSSTVVSPYMVTVLDDLTAAAARTTLGVLAPNEMGGPGLKHNYLLTPSVSSNALTMALKTLAGANASATDPIYIAFRNATLGTTTWVVRTITAALSTVISSGSTGGHTSAVAEKTHWYAIDNAGTVELAWSTSRIFDEGLRYSTTAEGGAGAADDRYTLYSTTARTNVAIRYLGFTIDTQATAGTWATAPSNVLNMPYSMPHAFRDEIILTQGNGFGSASTKIRRYTNNPTAIGTAMTYADSATLGMSVTINEEGMYQVDMQDTTGGGNGAFGVSVNNTQPTTDISAITTANQVGWTYNPSTLTAWFSRCIRLKPGDVLRAHGDATQNSVSANTSKFSVRRISD